ncbi:MAG: MBL fold metallo-hydrolase [bacterium]
MIITWYGQSCFKIQSKKLTIMTDPFTKEVAPRAPQLKADVITVSITDYIDAKLKKTETLKIVGPGEYEVQSNTINGIAARGKNYQQQDAVNTIYSMNIEGIKICHLGHLSEPLGSEQIEKINGTDILLVPISGSFTIDTKEAVKVINQIEPQIVIPMHYKFSGSKVKQDTVNDFCEEYGIKKSQTQDSLKIKAKDLTNDDMQAVLLKPIGS